MCLLVPSTGSGTWESSINDLSGTRPWVSKSFPSITSHSLKAHPVLKDFPKICVFLLLF